MDADRARELLAREKARIKHELADLSVVADEDSDLSRVDQHLGDHGTELFERERDDGLIADLQDLLEAIERAERRLAEGTYGLSVESGKPIPEARLDAIPWAERTVEEQAIFERSF